MSGQAQANFIATKDCDVRTIQLAADIDAGYAIGYDGNLAPAGGAMQGIARQNGLSGDYIGCTTDNTASAIVGAAVADGAELAVGADGKLVTAVTGNNIVARALSDSAAADLFIPVEVKSEGVKP